MAQIDFISLSVLVVGGAICVYWSRAMDMKRGRSPKPWIMLAVLFGPIALPILALLPKKS